MCIDAHSPDTNSSGGRNSANQFIWTTFVIVRGVIYFEGISLVNREKVSVIVNTYLFPSSLKSDISSGPKISQYTLV